MIMETINLKLNKEFALEWIRNLRSGEYIQDTDTRSLLKLIDYDNKTKYCCLGVACEMTLKKVNITLPSADNAGYPEDLSVNIVKSLLENNFEERLISSDLSKDKENNEYVSRLFARLNDGTDYETLKIYWGENLKFRFPIVENTQSIKLSFSQIADFIEDNFELV